MSALCRACGDLFDDMLPTCPHCGSSWLVVHSELADLTIAHIDCDAFYASVEKRDDPSLTDRPVVVGHAGGRGVVTTACYVARQYGLRSAMPMYRALELCPEVVVIPSDMAKYRRASAAIRALFARATPLVEPVSLDEAYLDLSPGIRHIDRPPAMLVARLARAIEREVGITVSVGLSYNRFLAKLASDRDKPRGFSVIGRAEAESLLAPLPVGAIHGVGAATARRMADMGLVTVADLQALTPADLAARFGKFGRLLAHLVRGQDPRPIVAARPTKSISRETTFRRDHSDPAFLRRALAPMVQAVAEILERRALAGHTVVLKLKTADFRVSTRQHRLGDATRRAAVILAAAELLLSREADGRAFRLIGVGVADLVPASAADAPDLFDALPS